MQAEQLQLDQKPEPVTLTPSNADDSPMEKATDENSTSEMSDGVDEAENKVAAAEADADAEAEVEGDAETEVAAAATAAAAQLVLAPRNTIVKRVLSIHEKLEICERAKTGEKKTKLAREYGVQPPAITKVVQNEKKWQAFMATNSDSGVGGRKQGENGKKRGRKRARLQLEDDAGQVEAGAAAARGYQNGALDFDKSDCSIYKYNANNSGALERSISAPSENGFGSHAWAHEHVDSTSSTTSAAASGPTPAGELGSDFAAAIGGARTCLEVLTRLNVHLLTQARANAVAGQTTTATNGLSQAQAAANGLGGGSSETAGSVNIVPIHWFHALYQIEHFFNLLIQQQQTQVEHE